MTKRAIYIGGPRYTKGKLLMLCFGMTGDILSENKDGSVHFKTDEGADWLLTSSEVHIS